MGAVRLAFRTAGIHGMVWTGVGCQGIMVRGRRSTRRGCLGKSGGWTLLVDDRPAAWLHPISLPSQTDDRGRSDVFLSRRVCLEVH